MQVHDKGVTMQTTQISFPSCHIVARISHCRLAKYIQMDPAHPQDTLELRCLRSLQWRVAFHMQARVHELRLSHMRASSIV
jgi:hypothetical protein